MGLFTYIKVSSILTILFDFPRWSWVILLDILELNVDSDSDDAEGKLMVEWWVVVPIKKILENSDALVAEKNKVFRVEVALADRLENILYFRCVLVFFV